MLLIIGNAVNIYVSMYLVAEGLAVVMSVSVNLFLGGFLVPTVIAFRNPGMRSYGRNLIMIPFDFVM